MPEELTSDVGLDGVSISLELAHYLHLLISTPGLRLAHISLRGCKLNGTLAPENRGIFRPSLISVQSLEPPVWIALMWQRIQLLSGLPARDSIGSRAWDCRVPG